MVLFRFPTLALATVMIVLSARGAAAQADLFEKSYGTGSYAYGADLIGTSDGGYLLVGAQGAGFVGSILIVRTDSDGDVVWQKTYGGHPDGLDQAWATAVVAAPDGGFVLSGYRNGLPTVMKVSSTGDSLWAVRNWSNGFGNANDLVATANGYVAAGTLFQNGFGASMIHLLTLSESGAVQSEKFFGDNVDPSRGNAIIAISDGGYVIGGTYGRDGDGRAALLKVDGAGTLLWDTVDAGIENPGTDDAIENVRIHPDGGFVLVGQSATSSDALDTDILLVRTDADGNILWRKTFGGAGYDAASEIAITGDGGFLLAGWNAPTTESSDRKGYLLRTDASGAFVGELEIDAEYIDGLLLESDGTVVVTGEKENRAFLARIVAPQPDLTRYDYIVGTSARYRFVSEDAWEVVGPGLIRSADRTVTINGFLRFDGTMTLDTARANNLEATTFTADGRFYVTDVPLPGGGRGEMTLYDGEVSNGSLSQYGLSLGLEDAGAEGPMFAGRPMRVAFIATIGDLAATGVELKGTMTFQDLKECDLPFQSPNIDVEGVRIDRNAISFGSIDELRYSMFFCLDPTSVIYDVGADAIDVIGRLLPSALIDSEQILGSVRFIDGETTTTLLYPDGNVELIVGNDGMEGRLREFVGELAFFDLFGRREGPMLSFHGNFLAPHALFEADIRNAVMTTAGSFTADVAELRMVPIASGGWSIGGSPRLNSSFTGGSFLPYAAEFDGELSAGKLANGGDVLDGSGQLTAMLFGTKPIAAGTITGRFTTPLTEPIWWFRIINNLNPGEIAENMTGTVKVSGDTASLFVTIMPTPGHDIGPLDIAFPPERVRFDLHKKELDHGYATTTRIDQNLNEGMRKLDEPSPQSSADRLETVEIGANIGEAILVAWGPGPIAGTYLIDPAGERIDAGRTDSSVIRYLISDTAHVWGLRNPAPGSWGFGLAEGSNADSMVALLYPKGRPFEIDVTQSGRTITATWDGAGATGESTVSFYLDRDTVGFDGIVIGEAPESVGTFTTTISDTLPECSYRLFGFRVDGAMLDMAYAAEVIDNARPGLGAPTNIVIDYTAATGELALGWEPSTDPSTVGYLVRVTDAEGRDSIYAMPWADQTSTAFLLENAAGVTIAMAAYDSLGARGCWSPELSIDISSVDEPTAGAATELGLTIAPNPLRAAAEATVTLASPGHLRATLVDNLGRTVATLADGRYEAGAHRLRIDAAALPVGRYLVVWQIGQRIGSQGIVVAR